MRFDIITLFPELFEPFLQAGVTRRAYARPEGGTHEPPQIDVRRWQLRDYAPSNYKRIDDKAYGGGPGMVMQPQPLFDALQAVLQDRGAASNEALKTTPMVFFTPTGALLQQRLVQDWANGLAGGGVEAVTGAHSGAVIICGRYEGIDQRFIDHCRAAHKVHEISVGDYVLSGGELAAMVFLDAIARLQPGVLNDPQSHAQDSFGDALQGQLDCPQYTRPEVWQGRSVPDVLLGGNHSQIAAWRRSQSAQLTAQRRPDLVRKQ